MYLKGLLKDFRRKTEESQKLANFLSQRAPRVNDLETRIHAVPYKKNDIAIYSNYEPSRIEDTRNSSFWQWHRVTEWYRYINDPIENISGHMIT